MQYRQPFGLFTNWSDRTKRGPFSEKCEIDQNQFWFPQVGLESSIKLIFDNMQVRG